MFCPTATSSAISNDVIEKHIESGADVTYVTKRVDLTFAGKRNIIIRSDSNNVITSMEESQGNETGPYDINTNILVMKRRFLVTELMEATAHNYTSFTHDIIARELKKRRIRAYRLDGYFVSVGSMTDYYNCSMELLDSAVRKQLFNVPGRPVLTKVRNSPPTKYAESAVVKNSLIADGCMIEGTVINSVIFRGVKVAKGAVVKNSIVMQDAQIQEGAEIDHCILDKQSVIRRNGRLIAPAAYPIVIAKNVVI